MKNTKQYTVPSLEILTVQETDVIRTSPAIDVGSKIGDWASGEWQ